VLRGSMAILNVLSVHWCGVMWWCESVAASKRKGK
jgi:hypothetical protein